jgi:hypothetical protein
MESAGTLPSRCSADYFRAVDRLGAARHSPIDRAIGIAFGWCKRHDGQSLLQLYPDHAECPLDMRGDAAPLTWSAAPSIAVLSGRVTGGSCDPQIRLELYWPLGGGDR